MLVSGHPQLSQTLLETIRSCFIATTRLDFVRHTQPEHSWEEDRIRPLTEAGKKDSKIVLDFLKDKKIDMFYCSPYKRSVDTILESASYIEKRS